MDHRSIFVQIVYLPASPLAPQVLEMDLMSRENLFDHVDRTGILTEPEAAGMVQNLLLAVCYHEETKCN